MGAASECRDAPSRRFYTHRRGPVAQSVEQGTFNPKVAGSIPARPIRYRMATPNGLGGPQPFGTCRVVLVQADRLVLSWKRGAGTARTVEHTAARGGFRGSLSSFPSSSPAPPGAALG